jgi:hypothetical protein
MPELNTDNTKTSHSIMGGDESNVSTANTVVNKAVTNKQFWAGVGLVVAVAGFITLAIVLMSSGGSSSGFAPIKYVGPNPVMSVRKERYMDKLPKNKKYGINERNISRFLNAPSEREFDRISMDNGSVVSSDSSLGYDLAAGNVEQSVIDSHREWADNSVIASAGANSKLMIPDHKTSINTRIGIWSYLTRAQDVYTDEGARVVNSEYPDQVDDVYTSSLAKSIGNHLGGGGAQNAISGEDR